MGILTTDLCRRFGIEHPIFGFAHDVARQFGLPLTETVALLQGAGYPVTYGHAE